ncbi:MAG: energy transducer TonB [Acidobacteriaceae bacterium]
MRSRRLIVGVAGVMVAGVFAVCAAVGQGADTSARVAAAARRNSLNLVEQRPWHLKLDVTVFDAEGKHPSEGTIEVWRSGADQRVLTTFGDSSRFTTRHNGEFYMRSSGPEVPVEADLVLQQVLDPGPGPSDIGGSTPELRIQKFGKTKLDCIMLTQPTKGLKDIPLGLYPTYCLDAKDAIRVSYNFVSRTVLINGVGEFLDHTVPIQMSIYRGISGQVVVATSKVSALSTYVPTPGEFDPTADMKAVVDLDDRKGGTVRQAISAGSRSKFVEPIYPEGPKQRHESGTVRFRAIIGRDGHIHSLRPTDDSDSEFVVAAIEAVGQWTYRPYELKGVPVEVDTTITVNFEWAR